MTATSDLWIVKSSFEKLANDHDQKGEITDIDRLIIVKFLMDTEKQDQWRTFFKTALACLDCPTDNKLVNDRMYTKLMQELELFLITLNIVQDTRNVIRRLALFIKSENSAVNEMIICYLFNDQTDVNATTTSDISYFPLSSDVQTIAKFPATKKNLMVHNVTKKLKNSRENNEAKCLKKLRDSATHQLTYESETVDDDDEGGGSFPINKHVVNYCSNIQSDIIAADLVKLLDMCTWLSKDIFGYPFMR